MHWGVRLHLEALWRCFFAQRLRKDLTNKRLFYLVWSFGMNHDKRDYLSYGVLLILLELLLKEISRTYM